MHEFELLRLLSFLYIRLRKTTGILCSKLVSKCYFYIHHFEPCRANDFGSVMRLHQVTSSGYDSDLSCLFLDVCHDSESMC